MKKTWVKKLVTAVVCVAILGTTFGMDYLFVKADTTNTDISSVKEIEAEFEITDENSGFPKKEETVFVITDSTGKTKDIQVTDWLKNTMEYEVLKDATNLNAIENINGDELVMREEEELYIQANGADIYYRGNVDPTIETPISLKVSYELDGVSVTPEELEEKTGHLKMTIQYTNQTNIEIEEEGELYNVCVPFAVTSVMMIPSEKISNVIIENGKVLETGTYAMVLGFGFPGLNESFGVEEGVFTDTVVLEADVEEYSVQTIMSYCSNNSFREVDFNDAVDHETIVQTIDEITNTSVEGLEEINSIDDLIEQLDDKKADLNQMNDGASTLNDGAKKINDGTNTLKNNMVLFDSNMKEAAIGADKLSSGASQAFSSSQVLASGASQVNAGASSLKSGIEGMYSSVDNAIYICNIALTLNGGETDYDNLCTAELYKVITAEQTVQKAAIEAGLTSVLESVGTTIALVRETGLASEQIAGINGQMGALTAIKSQMDSTGLLAGVATLSSGAAQVSNGAGQLSSGLATVSGSMNSLSEALNQLSSASEKLEQGSSDLANGSLELVDGTTKMKEGTQELVNLFKGDATDFVNTGKALQKAAESYTTFTHLNEEEEGSVSFIFKTE